MPSRREKRNHRARSKRRRLEQHGVEVYRLNPNGRISEFWALMRNTAAFDAFFA